MSDVTGPHEITVEKDGLILGRGQVYMVPLKDLAGGGVIPFVPGEGQGVPPEWVHVGSCACGVIRADAAKHYGIDMIQALMAKGPNTKEAKFLDAFPTEKKEGT